MLESLFELAMPWWEFVLRAVAVYVVVLVLVLLAGLTSLPRQPVWREAALSKPLESFAGRVKLWLPGGLSQRITYD